MADSRTSDHAAEAEDLLAQALQRGVGWPREDRVVLTAMAQVYAVLALVDAVRANAAAAGLAITRAEEIAAGCTCTPVTGPQDDCPIHWRRL